MSYPKLATAPPKRLRVYFACAGQPMSITNWLSSGEVTKRRAMLIDYPGSLDAMHEAEQTLSDEERDAYYLTLLDICCEFPGTHTYSATARQRAQAFVRTIAARKPTTL